MRGGRVVFESNFDTLVVSGKVNITIDALGQIASNDPKIPIAVVQERNVLRILSDNTGEGICFRGEGVNIRGLKVDSTSSCTIRVKSIQTTGVISIFGDNVFVNNKKVEANAPERQPVQNTFLVKANRNVKKIQIEGQSKTMFDVKNGLLGPELNIIQTGDAKLYFVENGARVNRLNISITGNGKIKSKNGGRLATGELEVYSSGAGTLKGILVARTADIHVSGVGLVEITALDTATISEETSGLGEIILHRLSL